MFHYDGKTAGGFSILGRFARMNRADTVDDANATTTRSFPEGTAVVLYGYSIPTTSRIPEGSGTLAADLGRLNVLLLSSASPPDAWPHSQGSGGGTTTGGGGGGGGLPALVRGWRGDTITLNLGQDVTGWDGRTGSEAAQAFGQKGYAILASGDGNFALTFVGDTTNARLFDAARA